jgi:hypothetical protein
MKIKFNSLWLAGGLMEGTNGLALSGAQVVDSAALFRAVDQKFFARGNRSESISFTVSRSHGSIKAAQLFLVSHYKDLPNEGDLFFYCGFEGDEQIVTLEGAVLASVSRNYNGETTFFTYNILGGVYRTDITPGPDPDPDNMRIANTPVDEGAAELEITFSSPMTGTPICNPTMRSPDGADAVFCWTKKGSESADGFTVVFSAPIPGSGYEVSWTAFA